jgi:hypothetical protein
LWWRHPTLPVIEISSVVSEMEYGARTAHRMDRQTLYSKHSTRRCYTYNWYPVSHTEDGTRLKVLWDQSVEKKIWTYGGVSKKGNGKIR